VGQHAHTSANGTRASAMLALCAVLLGVAFTASASGCAKPLLSPEEPRSQYDRSDRLRGRSSPPYVTDEFGKRRPNVRGRLLAGD
jgi:hypothetical protein